MHQFSEKVILVVGASSGIGKKTAEVLAKQDAKVILIARREEKLIHECELIGVDRAFYYVLDVSDLEEIEGCIKKIVAEHGKLDGMVYTAGIVEDVPLRFLNHERLLKTFDVNFFAFIEFVRQVSKINRFNYGMRIVAVSSVSSLLGEKAHTSYAASKAAMDAAVRCLAKELNHKGISINSVQPGMIRTDMYDDFVGKMGEDSSVIGAVNRSQYAGIGNPEDVAHVISFLLSYEAKFITGISLPVDGGASTSA